MTRARSLNGAGYQPQPSADHHDHPHGTFQGHFDLEDGGLISRPRTLLAIAIGMFIIGGTVALIHYRLGHIEEAVSEIPEAIERRIEQSEQQQSQARKIECLQQQIANRNWTCPDAVAAAEPPPAAPKRRTAAKKPTPAPYFNPFNLNALAGGK